MFIPREIPVIYYAVEYQTLPWQRIKKEEKNKRFESEKKEWNL